jgi:hypothetical protein
MKFNVMFIETSAKARLNIEQVKIYLKILRIKFKLKILF